MNQDLRNHISRTIVAIRRKAPFYAYLATTREFVEDPEAETCWTNGPRIGVNPIFALGLTVDEFRTVIVHELEHVRKGDPWRLRLFLAGRLSASGQVTSEEHQRWNKAADHSINNRLRRAGFTPVDGWLCDPTYDGWSTERIFPLMEADPENSENKNSQSGAGAEAVPVEGAEGSESKNAQNGLSNGDEDAKGSDGPPGPTEANTESAGGLERDSKTEGETADGRDEATKPNPCGECRPFDGTAEEAQRELDSRKLDCRNAQRYAEGIGNMDAVTSEEVTKMLEPAVDYAELLAEFMHEQLMNSNDWTRLRPEYLLSDIGVPRMNEPAIGDVVLFVDTSGSMNAEAFQEVAGHITDVCRDLDARLHVLCVDSMVRNYQVFEEAPELSEIVIKGGGNTSFKPGFDFVEDREIDPACAIYFTDMCCSSWPLAEPDYPVLFVQWGNKKVIPGEMPFGELLHCGKEV